MKNILPMLLALAFVLEAVAADVQTLRVPGDGIQPQVEVDSEGVLHMVYFKGDPGAGDLYYARLDPGKEAFSNPLRVNSIEGSAVAKGTIRGGQIAVGRKGRVHVAWNASWKGHGWKERPKKMTAEDHHLMFYARMNDAGTAFEPRKDVMTRTFGLDGGGSVAADDQGNVWVVWGGREKGSPEGEAGRAIYVAASSDGGRTFASEARANPRDTGVCACCGLKAFADRKGRLFIAYRIAQRTIDRDSHLLVSTDGGRTFAASSIDRWRLAMCPMSSYSIRETARGVMLAWESERKVYFNGVDRPFPKALAAPGSHEVQQKPQVAVNEDGEILTTWLIGSGWGGRRSLAWQVYDSQGKPLGDPVFRRDAIPEWGLAAAAALPGGSFVIVH